MSVPARFVAARLVRAAALALAVALAGCADAPKKAAAPPPDPAPRNGVVGLVSEVKTRGVNETNWQGAIGGLFSMDPEKGVLNTAYEVTVFYDDGSTGTVTVRERPALQPGQKVRVTGDRIELRR